MSEQPPDDIAAAQKVDLSIGKVYPWVQTDARPTNKELARYDEETKAIVARWKNLALRDDLLVHNVTESHSGREIHQVILPPALRETVLHQLHDLRIVGHLGIQRVIARVKQRFFWPELALDVARWCALCPQCMARKGKPHPRHAPLTQLPTGAPFD